MLKIAICVVLRAGSSEFSDLAEKFYWSHCGYEITFKKDNFLLATRGIFSWISKERFCNLRLKNRKINKSENRQLYHLNKYKDWSKDTERYRKSKRA